MRSHPVRLVLCAWPTNEHQHTIFSKALESNLPKHDGSDCEQAETHHYAGLVFASRRWCQGLIGVRAAHERLTAKPVHEDARGNGSNKVAPKVSPC